MSKIKCKLVSDSDIGFLQQLYTGLFLLHKSGLIDLKQTVIRHKGEKDESQYARVIVNDEIKLYYDMKDGWGIDKESLSNSDFYFKRSYSPIHLKSLGDQQRKIFPYGLNYKVFPSAMDRFAIQRTIVLSNGKNKITGMVRPLNIGNPLRFIPRMNIMQSLPDFKADPKIIFMVKAYDPYDKPDRPEENIEERIQINETRASCIRLLRSEFGNRFYGGFYHTDYTENNYRDYLMLDKNMSLQRNYINLVKSFPICIANSGLHGSIGWKFAEYIAFSKAIVTEKMDYEVTGNLEKGKNYLEFRSPEECVEKTSVLFTDKGLRNEIMTQNSKYYHSYLRPDSLILHSILTALSEREKISA
jgi:hypothetical protein